MSNIEGMQGKQTLRIFVADPVHHRFFAEVHSGPQKGIKTIVKLPVRDMIDIYKGEKKLIILRLY